MLGYLPRACLCLRVLNLVKLLHFWARHVEGSLRYSLTTFRDGGITGNEDAADVETLKVVVQVDFGERVSFVGVDVCLLDDQGEMDGNTGEVRWGEK